MNIAGEVKSVQIKRKLDNNQKEITNVSINIEVVRGAENAQKQEAIRDYKEKLKNL